MARGSDAVVTHWQADRRRGVAAAAHCKLVAQLVVVPLAMGQGAKSPGFDSHRGLSFQKGRGYGWIGLNPPRARGSWIITELCKKRKVPLADCHSVACQ